MSEINLRQETQVSISGNKIIFVDNSPRVFFQLSLKFTKNYPVETMSEDPSQEDNQVAEVVTNKQFDDFLIFD